jgi:hypothetical protein
MISRSMASSSMIRFKADGKARLEIWATSKRL